MDEVSTHHTLVEHWPLASFCPTSVEKNDSDRSSQFISKDENTQDRNMHV